MTTIEKITNWLTANPGQHTAATIATGIGAAASTVRTNTKKMGLEAVKIKNVGHYSLASSEQPVEAEPEVTVEPAPAVVVSTPETPAPAVVVNVERQHKATPRALIAKLRERQAKHRTGMETGYTPRDRQQSRRHYKRTTARLEALETVHG